MSAYVLNQDAINLLTQATDAMLRLNAQYPGSYQLSDSTIELLGQYKNDLHNIYRALYIANIKAVNGRYSTDQKTLPKYKKLIPWEVGCLNRYTPNLKKACGTFGCYMYQISEAPIYDTPIYKAFADIRRLCCMIYVDQEIGWGLDD